MRIIPITILLFVMLPSCKSGVDNKTTTNEEFVYKVETELNYKNPAVMAGSDFLNIFKRLLVNQDYHSMLLFTSNETKEKFGEKTILEFYERRPQLGFEIKLKSVKYNQDSTTCTLNYQASIFSTTQIKTIKCVVENDTAKISLENVQTIFVNVK
jgi:hypothetical protein